MAIPTRGCPTAHPPEGPERARVRRLAGPSARRRLAARSDERGRPDGGHVDVRAAPAALAGSLHGCDGPSAAPGTGRDAELVGRRTATRARRSSSPSSTRSATTSPPTPIGFTGDAALRRATTRSSPRRSTARHGPATGSRTPHHLNNAGFLALPDGTPGLLQTYLFSHGANPRRTATSTPRTTRRSSTTSTPRPGEPARHRRAGLRRARHSAQAGAIGEGTSDFYAMDFLVGDADRDDDAPGEHRVGSYLDDDDPRGLRYQAIDCDPGSTGSLLPGRGRHGRGRLHLRRLRQRGRRSPRSTPTARSGPRRCGTCGRRVGARRRRAASSPAGCASHRPSRRSSTCATRSSAGHRAGTAIDGAQIWEVFAARGMGYFASTDGGSDVAPVADFETEPTGGRSC